jgi:hypothetical protein
MSADLAGASIYVLLWVALWTLDRVAHLDAPVLTVMALVDGTLAFALMSSDRIASTATCGGMAVWCAYHAWKRRKPRQRKPSRAAGMVRDLGHRLVVTSS